MFRPRTLFALSLGLLLCVALASQEMHSPARSTAAFDQLKSLAGEWTGKTSTGSPVQVAYKIISNGSVVMETLQPANEAEMITMYSLDGDRIFVTHYCSAGNQPTMQTAPSPATNGKLDFSFLRVTGTATHDEGHMVALSLDLTGKDHFTQTWTFLDHGKSTMETFTYARVK
jgi:hypothetical protein